MAECTDTTHSTRLGKNSCLLWEMVTRYNNGEATSRGTQLGVTLPENGPQTPVCCPSWEGTNTNVMLLPTTI